MTAARASADVAADDAPEPRRASRQTVDDVHRAIRDAILDGTFTPGQVMSQVTLADRFGVSRTPLREALRMLQSEGLIDSEPNRRVRVAEVSMTDIEELATMRIPLEVAAIRLSVGQMVSEEIAALEGQMAAMAHFAVEHDYGRWEVPHRAFHRTLTAHAGERYNLLLAQLFDHAERYRRMHFGASVVSERSTADHRAILDACKQRDADLAGVRLAEHLAHTALDIFGEHAPEYDPAALRQVLGDVPRRSAKR
jgi:DNA-binding GntR family transcriptional regulator